MAGTELGYWDYVKAAFHLKARIPLLGHMPVNKLALAGFAILGLGNPGFLLLGIGYEAAYLLFLSGNRRFQNTVRGERLLQLSRQESGQEEKILAQLDVQSRARYDQLVQRCRGAMQADREMAGAESFAGIKAEGINQLLLIYLKMLNLRNRILQSISRTRREELETDIKSLTQRLAQETGGSPVARTLQGTLDIQKARLDNYTKNLDRIRFAEAELDRIEKQVSLIAEEVVVGKNAEQWSRILDGVVQSIQGTTQWMADNSEILESVDATGYSGSLGGSASSARPVPPIKQK